MGLTWGLWPCYSDSSKDDDRDNILKVHFEARLRLEFFDKVLTKEGDKMFVFLRRL